MPNLLDQTNFRSLAESVEILKEPNDFLGKMCFPRIEEFATSAVDFDVFEQSRKVLAYVSRQVEGSYVSKQGFSTNTVTPPYLKPKFSVTASDVEKRLAGRPLYIDNGSDLSDEFAEYLSKRIYNELEVLMRRTIMTQQADAAKNGSVTALNAAGGVEYTVNYQRDSSLNATGVSDFTSDPLALMRARSAIMSKLAGKRGAHVVLGATALDAFRVHAKVTGALSKDWSSRGQLGYTPDSLGAAWVGVADGVNYWYLEDWYVDSTGTLVPVVGDKYALMFGEGVGAMYYGGLELLENRRAARGLKTWAENDPDGQVIQLHSAPLAVTTHRNGFAYFQVIA